ncbi:FliA/WhiG family RNA polymerase sigma factor, partial [Vibrio parahaemolyticus]
TLFYQHELNLHEIALVLDLTPPRICQLHKQALKQLNQLMSS